MKKIGFFVLLFVLVPTVSLSASGVTIDDCIDYMQNFTNNKINVENTSSSFSSQNPSSNNENYMMDNYDNYMMNNEDDNSENTPCH